jgi:hypothetical protein
LDDFFSVVESDDEEVEKHEELFFDPHVLFVVEVP